jgi:NodT family efflux transporter outer membrane factor (OMF) lipoprotein
VRLALASDLAGAVVNWRALAEQTSLARGDLQQATTLTEITAERVRVGVASDTDRVRAAGLVADARARLSALDGRRAEVLGQIVTLTARPAQEVATILGEAPGVAGSADLPGGISTAVLRNRPDVAAAEARLRAADQDVATAAAERFPRLTLSAIVGVAALAFGDLFEAGALTGSVGPTLAGPLLDFGRVGARIDGAEAGAREAFAEYRRVTFLALGEAERAFGQARSAAVRAAELRRQVTLNEDAARLVEIRYRSGLENFVGVVDARRQAFASRQALAVAVGEASTARIALFRALGGADAPTGA